jgi:hypothetical protein
MPFRPGLDDDPYLDEVIAIWRNGSAEIDRRLAHVQQQMLGVLSNPSKPYVTTRLEAQAARLGELRDQAAFVLDDALQQTGRYVQGERFAELYAAGSRLAVQEFSFTAPHRAAVQALARDTYSDMLTATAHVDEDAKAFVRRVSRQIAATKLTAGDSAAQSARDLKRSLEREFRGRGIGAITYRDGSRHSFGEYAEMAMRTKTAQAYNAGTLNTSRAAGIEIFEILDGALCGLTAHHDSQLANGMIVDSRTANDWPLSHPACRRAFSPRPDLSAMDLSDAPSERSVTTAPQRSDQAAFERELAARRGGSRGGPGGSPGGRRPRRERRARPTAGERRSGGLSGRQQVTADNARRRRAIERARLEAREKVAQAFEVERQGATSKGGRVPADVLQRWRVSEDQLRHGRVLAKQVKADIRAAARREADDLGGWLAENDLDVMTRPARLERKVDASGRVRQVRTDSGYDFLEQLDDAGDARVRKRFVDDLNYRPDTVADQVRRKTNLDLTDSEAMDWLTDRWLQEDGLRSLASGRVPRYADPANLLPAEYQLEGYDLTRLFGVDVDDAAGHVARVQADAAHDYAARILPRPKSGRPGAWEMDPLDFVDELERIEDAARAVEFEGATPGPGFRGAMDRLRELVPPDIDPTGQLNPFELHERIRLTAQTAGYLDPGP